MGFIEFIAVIRRHKVLAGVGVVVALLVAIFSAYTLDGAKLVSRSRAVYETTAVVAIKPGAETTPVAPPLVVVPGPTSASSTPSPAGSDVIDSRKLYYAALSLQTAVQAPGFAERVGTLAPGTDGSIAAVVPLDTNTIRLIVDGSSPGRAADSMDAALSELGPLVDRYANSRAFRYTLQAQLINGPSTPRSVSSIKGPLTAAVVFGVLVVILWLSIRAIDLLRLHQRETARLRQAQQRLKAANGDGPGLPAPTFPPSFLEGSPVTEGRASTHR